MRRLQTVLLISCVGGALAARAQVPVTPDAPVFTLHTGTKMVLTDVSVTDAQGRPVHGLDRSAFRIFDNGQLQPLATFEEHIGPPAFDPSIVPARQVYTNVYRLHPPAASNVLFIDSTRLGSLEQMYLAEELTHFVEALPSGTFLALYSRSGTKVQLLQDFTSDRELLRTAVAKAIPHLREAGASYGSDLTALLELSGALQSLPGRKNVLWFSGGSDSPLLPDAAQLAGGVNLQQVYDEIEANRISIYPVDARGNLVTTPVNYGPQHLLMENVAEATGGQAFYYDNGFAHIASRVVNEGESFYTLAYSLQDPKFDDKWHKVAVTVDGDRYTLSYRRGYFNDGVVASRNGQATTKGTARKLLTRDGEARSLPDPEISRQPLIFYASVEPAAPGMSRVEQGQSATALPQSAETTYLIHFHLPASEFVHGQPEVVVNTGVLALNCLGESIGRLQRQVTLRVDEDKLLAHPDGFLSFDQQINLVKGEDFLELAVIDPDTGRAGLVHVPVDVMLPQR